MEIYFLRHASAGEPKLNPAKDEQRPLDKLGIEQSYIVGHALAAMKIKLDAIIFSPLVRAKQTAAIVASEIGRDDKLVTDDALRPDATYEQFEQLLARYSGKDAILLVGHNPSQTEFLNQLVMGKGSAAIELKKGAIARVDKDGHNPAVLKWCMPPKVVRAIQRGSASSSRPKTVSK
ncbi:MAG TPA: phosphohistidine phosphatase SixA [Terracidiphilus sp.]|nr:phosphohistidine phosphatase SixA [Terracidiphilus sp.]